MLSHWTLFITIDGDMPFNDDNDDEDDDDDDDADDGGIMICIQVVN